MKRYRKKNDVLFLSVLTVITVLTWIGFDVYRALNKPKVPKVLKEQMRALSPKFDEETLEKLNQRLKITEEELKMLEEKLMVTPEASPPAMATSPPVATEGAAVSEEAPESSPSPAGESTTGGIINE